MSYDLGLSKKLDFTKKDLTLPDKILKDLSEEIKNETGGAIEGIVQTYSGHIRSYTKRVGAIIDLPRETEVNIQDDLGAVGNKIKKFEFCIGTPAFENFRYRLMFIEYDLSVYPVTVVLEEKIAAQIHDKPMRGYTIQCESRQEFEAIVIRAIQTKRVVEMMQQLLNATESQKEQKVEKASDIIDNDI